MSLTWTAWNNGDHNPSGAGYGFKVPILDRDRYFKQSWSSVTVELPGTGLARRVTVNVGKLSFWSDVCRELISKDIGRWLIECGLAPWPRGNPPQLLVEVQDDRQFVVVGVQA